MFWTLDRGLGHAFLVSVALLIGGVALGAHSTHEARITGDPAGSTSLVSASGNRDNDASAAWPLSAADSHWADTHAGTPPQQADAGGPLIVSVPGQVVAALLDYGAVAGSAGSGSWVTIMIPQLWNFDVMPSSTTSVERFCEYCLGTIAGAVTALFAAPATLAHGDALGSYASGLEAGFGSAEGLDLLAALSPSEGGTASMTAGYRAFGDAYGQFFAHTGGMDFRLGSGSQEYTDAPQVALEQSFGDAWHATTDGPVPAAEFFADPGCCERPREGIVDVSSDLADGFQENLQLSAGLDPTPLRPVPEPGTLMLVGLGLAGLLASARLRPHGDS